MKWVMGSELMVVGSGQKGDMKKMENVSDNRRRRWCGINNTRKVTMWERPGFVSVMALVLLTMSIFSSEYTLNCDISEKHSRVWKNTVLFGISVLLTLGNITKVDTGFEFTPLICLCLTV